MFLNVSEFDDYAEIVDDDDYADPIAGRIVILTKCCSCQSPGTLLKLGSLRSIFCSPNVMTALENLS